jgi:hypothetical protein
MTSIWTSMLARQDSLQMAANAAVYRDRVTAQRCIRRASLLQVR